MPEPHFSILPFLYRLYERRLLKQVHASPIPQHIGIILDGNRRYGRRENLVDAHAVYIFQRKTSNAVQAKSQQFWPRLKISLVL